MMHIFCDESGGAAERVDHFVMAAVLVSGHQATRLIRRFRKAAGISGEIKGHLLTVERRRIFFDMLLSRCEAFGVAVTCSRHDRVGRWAMRHLAEPALYRNLVVESCVAIPFVGAARLTVIADRPRYTKAVAEAARAAIVGDIGARHAGCAVACQFGDSATVAGLQIADVIANSVYHALGNAADAADVKAMLDRCVEAGQLVLRTVELAGVRPAHLMQGPDTTKPPDQGGSEVAVDAPPILPSQ